MMYFIYFFLGVFSTLLLTVYVIKKILDNASETKRRDMNRLIEKQRQWECFMEAGAAGLIAERDQARRERDEAHGRLNAEVEELRAAFKQNDATVTAIKEAYNAVHVNMKKKDETIERQLNVIDSLTAINKQLAKKAKEKDALIASLKQQLGTNE